MTSIWRDFCKALVAAARRPDEAALRAERGRAVRRLAEEKIREQERRPAGPDRPTEPTDDDGPNRHAEPTDDDRPTEPASGEHLTGPAGGVRRPEAADEG